MDQFNPTIEEIEAQLLKPLSPDEVRHQDTRVLSLKLQLTQAAMCHQYARLEYERTVCVIRRGELHEEMSLYHTDYQEARIRLSLIQPQLLDELEHEILSQRQCVFSEYVN